jgi:hypothetical protein
MSTPAHRTRRDESARAAHIAPAGAPRPPSGLPAGLTRSLRALELDGLRRRRRLRRLRRRCADESLSSLERLELRLLLKALRDRWRERLPRRPDRLRSRELLRFRCALRRSRDLDLRRPFPAVAAGALTAQSRTTAAPPRSAADGLGALAALQGRPGERRGRSRLRER